MLKEKYDHRHYYFFFYTVAHNKYGVFVSDKKDIISLFLREMLKYLKWSVIIPKFIFKWQAKQKYIARYTELWKDTDNYLCIYYFSNFPHDWKI